MDTDNEVITFDQALQETEGSPRVLLLGNGFSRAYFGSGNDPFSWESLGDSLDALVTDVPVKKLRERLGENDVEFMARKLQQAAKVAGCYDLILPNSEENRRVEIDFENHAKKLQDGLVLAIADKHPITPDQDKLRNCLAFLNHFIPKQGNTGSIFTLSYDQLLNWASLASPDKNDRSKENGLNKDDGFRTEGRFFGIDPIKLHYLHGALHLWSNGIEPFKLTGKGTDPKTAGRTKLLERIKEEFETGSRESLTVVGGTSEEKLRAIKKSSYLRLMRDRFKKKLGDDNASLFVYGVSFDKNDDHIFEAVRDSKVKSIYISTTKLEPKPEMQDKVALIKASRARAPEAAALTVRFFDANSARPWGDEHHAAAGAPR